MSKNGAQIAIYGYDGDGQRVSATAGGRTTLYVSDLFEWQVETSVATRYYYAGGQRVAMRVGSALSFLLADHLGSTSITLDASGTRVAELRYKAFGETRYSQGNTPTARRYTGQYEGIYINLYWYGSRWYDPALGRFISPDSIIPDPANPLDFDRYAYTRNNPVKYTDPTGHWVETALDLLFIAYDVQQIVSEGWTLTNTAALAADVACAIIPIGTGGGPAVRAVMAGSDAALAYAKAATHVPTAVKAAQGAEKALQQLDGDLGGNVSFFANSTQGHHALPQYLLGPKKQDLYNLSNDLHSTYHNLLDKSLPRQLGKDFYEQILKDPAKQRDFYQYLLDFNKYFDETYGTHTYEALENVLRDEGLLPKPK